MADYPERLNQLPDGEYLCEARSCRVKKGIPDKKAPGKHYTIVELAFVVRGVPAGSKKPGDPAVAGRVFENSDWFFGGKDKVNAEYPARNFESLGYVGAKQWAAEGIHKFLEMVALAGEHLPGLTFVGAKSTKGMWSNFYVNGRTDDDRRAKTFGDDVLRAVAAGRNAATEGEVVDPDDTPADAAAYGHDDDIPF